MTDSHEAQATTTKRLWTKTVIGMSAGLVLAVIACVVIYVMDTSGGQPVFYDHEDARIMFYGADLDMVDGTPRLFWDNGEVTEARRIYPQTLVTADPQSNEVLKVEKWVQVLFPVVPGARPSRVEYGKFSKHCHIVDSETYWSPHEGYRKAMNISNSTRW